MDSNPTMGGAPVLVEGPTEWYMLYCDGIYVIPWPADVPPGDWDDD